MVRSVFYLFIEILGEFVIRVPSHLGDDATLNQLLIDTHNAVAYHGQSKEEIAEGHLQNRSLVIQ